MVEEKNALKQQKGKLLHRILLGVGIAVLCLGASAGVMVLVVRINRAEYGIYLLPFLLSMGVFFFSTLGFFLTEGKKEILYGVCSIAGAACAVVQMALIF